MDIGRLGAGSQDGFVLGGAGDHTEKLERCVDPDDFTGNADLACGNVKLCVREHTDGRTRVCRPGGLKKHGKHHK